MVETGTITVEDLLEQADWLRRLARRLARDEGEADDLAQETLSTALSSPPRAGGGLRGWLATVLRRIAARQRRRDAARTLREAAAARAPEERDPARIAARVELQRLVAGEILRLKEPYRTTVVLRYFEDRNPKEIARLTGCTPATVRVRLHRARSELRRRLDDRHDGNRGAWLAPLLAGGTLMSKGKLAAAFAVTLFLVCGVTTLVGPAPLAEEHPAPAAVPPAPTPVADPGPAAVKEESEPGPVLASDEPAPARGVRGRILAPDGSPVTGARIYAMDPEGEPQTDTSSHRTGEGGRFVLTGLAAGREIDLVVDAEGYLPAIVPIRDLPEEGAEVVLDPGLSIRGTLIDDAGRPVETAVKARRMDRDRWIFQIFSRRDSVRNSSLARSDAQGRFELRGLSPGVHRVEKATINYLAGPGSIVDCKAGETGVKLVLYPAVTLKILVRDDGGAPFREPFDVRIVYESGRADKAASHVGKSGEMLLRGVPRGRCRLVCTAVNHEPAVLGPLDLEPSPEPRMLTVRMRALPGHGFGDLRGRVRGPDGELPPGVKVSVKVLELGWWTRFPVDGDGRFVVPHLPAGEYHVRAESEDGGWVSVRAAAEATAGAPVDLRLERAGSARLRIAARSECEAEAVDCFVLDREGFAVLRGRSDASPESVEFWAEGHSFGPLVPGAYRAVAAADGRLLADADLLVVAGEERSVTLILPRQAGSAPAPVPREVRTIPKAWTEEKPAPEPAKAAPADWVERLGSESVQERFDAAVKLAEVGKADAVGPLVRVLLEDADLFVRRAAARALGRIGDESAVPALIRTLGHDSTFLAGVASAAIQEITGERPAWRPGLTRAEREKLVKDALSRWNSR